MNSSVQDVSEYAYQRAGERRQARLYSLLYGLYKPRRAGDRRETLVAKPPYLDVHGPYLYTLVLSIMLFCVADAYFTLILIEHGSKELNPFLAWALEKDAMLFYSIKYSLTAICVYLLMLHKQFLVFGLRGYHFLIAVLLCYATLITYQISMLVKLL